MSTLTIKTENSSKILPGDKSGLPLELWQIILSGLSAWDLCQVCCVCKTWNSFMRCVDSTRWKELYLSSTEWKHPKWPLNIESEPSSWKLEYKEQYLSSKFWQNGIKNVPIVSCLSVLKRNRVKKLINVGPGQEHENLRSALLVANDYDRICVHPGIYDEQFEMSSKIPFELVGCGELGSVILVVCIEQIAPTGRLSNLVLRAPWFTSFILKVRSGFMQIDNCILEDGMIYAQNPGTCHVRFSSFRHAAVILQHMNATVIEHCEFSQSDTADIIVEGHVKDDKNWTYSYLCQHTRNLILPHAQSDVLEEKSNDIETSTNENTQKTNVTNENEGDVSHVITVVEVPNAADTVKRNSVSVVTERMSSVSEWVNNAPLNPAGSTPSLTTASVAEAWSVSETSNGSLYDLDDLGSNSVTDPESRQSHHSSFSSGEDSPSMIQSDSEDDLSDGSVIMLPHLRQHHLRLTQSKQSRKQNDNLSVDSSYFKPIRFDLTKDSTAKDMLNQVKGCLIHACRMSHSKGGVMVSLQGQAIISECDISNVSYGIRCIQNAQVIILKNKIHHCRTSGIFMRLASSGLVAGNDIHSNLEAGIDIRKNADPIIQHNRIHNGKRSGIVVLGSGRGQIEKNDIYENKEAGVYVLYGGNPTISGNYIYDGHAAGIAVNEGGRGIITDNTIRGNQWGGIDIRHEANPIVIDNTIVNGIGDGVVIGERGIGSLENNIISGNAGCGVWIMNANNPYIHGNQINNNGDCGIMLVDKSDVLHEGTAWMLYTGVDRYNTYRDEQQITTSQSTIIQYNNIYHNQGKGMSVQHGDKVVVKFNAIHANQSDGMLIDQEAKVEVISNSVTTNKGSGLVTSNSGTAEVIGNGVFENREGGIVCCNQATISHNDVVGNENHGITLHGNLSVNVCNNRVQSKVKPAVKIDQVKNAVIENNIIYDEETTQLNNEHDTNRKGLFSKSDFLKNPDVRPHIDPPPEKSQIPPHYMSDITHVTVPSTDICPQGSNICSIL